MAQTTDEWISPTSGAWDVAANWDPAQTPVSTSDVIIAGGGSLMVTGPVAPVTIDSLLLVGTGGGGVTLNLQLGGDLYVSKSLIVTTSASIFIGGANVTAASLTIDTSLVETGPGSLSIRGNETLNSYDAASITQTGGSNFISGGWLTLGGPDWRSGTYTLGGSGSLSVNGTDSNGVSEYIGNGGWGVVVQCGGTNTFTGAMDIGGTYPTEGYYELDGGIVQATGYDGKYVSEYVGENGPGYFNQTGGLNLCAGLLDVGYGAAGTGTYTLSGTGSLSAVAENIGYKGGYGIFNQTGGTNNLSSGAQSIGPLDLGVQVGSTGTYILSGSSTLTVGNPLFGQPYFPTEAIGGYGTGHFNQSGGANIVYGEFVVENTDSTYDLSGGLLSVQSTVSNNDSMEYVGESYASTFCQSGGTNMSAGGLTLGGDVNATGTYRLSGNGTLLVGGNELVGDSGSGIFSQSGGTNIAWQMAVGNNLGSTGSYNLSGTGSLTVSTFLSLGNSGKGVFNQTGGTNSIGGQLDIAYDNYSTGTYLLSNSGTLSATQEFVGNFGIGSFNQSGGTNIAQELILDGFDGTYILGGSGVLDVEGSGEYVAGIQRGNFIQAGGSNTTNLMYIALYPGDFGTYELSGGSLNADEIDVGGSSSVPGGDGILTVSGAGQLRVTGSLNVYEGGRVNINGGSASVGSLSIAGNGIVDLNAALQIDYRCPSNDPVATIVSYLQTGYNGGAWTGTSGIISSMAAARVMAGTSPVLSIGYADGNVDNGQGNSTVTQAAPNQVLVMLTLAGDANLDGNVDFNDLFAVGKHLNTTGNDWADGNFNYATNGAVDFNDLFIIGQNLNQTLSDAGIELGGNNISLGQTTKNQIVSVPEPIALLLAVVSASGLLARRPVRRAHRRASAAGFTGKDCAAGR